MSVTQPLLVRLSPVDRQILQKLAEAHSVPMAAVVRLLLRGVIRAKGEAAK
jgi:hypothetical protein